MKKLFLNLSTIVLFVLLSQSTFAAFQEVEVYEFYRGSDTQIAYATVTGAISYQLFASVYVDDMGNKGHGTASARIYVANELIRAISVANQETRNYNGVYSAYGTNTYKLEATCYITHKYMPFEGGFAQARVRVTW